jgi:uncharacterized protein with GYD domain
MKVLFEVAYTPESIQALLETGSTARQEGAKRVIEGMGGTLEGYYLAFGETDLYILTDLPDRETAAAIALYTSRSGSINVKTTILLTSQEVDQAAKKAVDYEGA